MPTSLTENQKKRLEREAERVLSSYRIRKPPLPIERVLSEPPEVLEAVDIADLSLVFGKGDHRYEYRMAIARLIYRELCRQEAAQGTGMPYTAEASQYFAATLLVPRAWLQRATRWPWNDLHKLSETFQVPEYVMASRLSELGKHVRGME